jgi:serine kinase of HPr protein (carbohydrate metabolism regulator)|tara:strand:+ start:1778 stop:1960 length:183 start_codon:yes stop_codon:yes gene_type:complete
MAKFLSDHLDEFSQAMVGHKEWAYLDEMSKEKQLDVIQNYNHREANQKYIVVVFPGNKEE